MASSKAGEISRGTDIIISAYQGFGREAIVISRLISPHSQERKLSDKADCDNRAFQHRVLSP